MEKKSKMTTVEARNKFSELINQVAYGKKRIILTRRGKDIVAVVPIEDLRVLEEEAGIISKEKVIRGGKARPKGYHR